MGLLKQRSNCWRISSCDRASFLVDGENYYKAFYEAVLAAKKRIFIVGWDIDSKLELVRGDEISRGKPKTLRKLLDYVLAKNDDLEVYILTWDFNPVFLKEREWFSKLRFTWKASERLHFVKDNGHPFTGSQHEKLVVIDDKLAFCGGLDLTANRWDTRTHKVVDRRRINSSHDLYVPFHDVELMVEGKVAEDLGDLVRERWYRATRDNIAKVEDKGKGDFDFFDWEIGEAKIGIARTRPEFKGYPEVREIERLFVDMIENAKNEIFIENQYFSSKVIHAALVETLKREDGPYVTMILPQNSGGVFQDRTVGRVQNPMLKTLYQADTYNRLAIYCPRVHGAKFFKIHSKLMVVDDTYFRVGSANTINRSMGLDTETDLVIDGSESEVLREKFRFWKLDIVAEHLGVSVGALEDELDKVDDLNLAIKEVSNPERGRYLQFMEIEKYQKFEENMTFSEFCDLESPSKADLMFDFIYLKTRHMKQRFHHSLWFRSGFFLSFLMIAFVTLNVFIEGFTTAEVRNFIVDNTGSFAQLVIAPLVFVLFSILLIPLNILVIVIATFFPLKSAMVTMILGMSLAIVVDYFFGLMFRNSKVLQKFLKEYSEFKVRLNNMEFWPIILLRVFPVLPFSVVNFLAGTLQVNLLKFWAGTLLGVLPAAMLVLLFQKSLLTLVANPSFGGSLVFLMMLGLVLLLGGFVKRRLLGRY
ncbi:hypothetical protein CVV38_04090 [Candidatus Peregrinibacteria bacterium HGW-Peregrinibacteria-1]|jgi:phosphatidylserine/phosphatidylglycerophosphate/cardiolipin synthase-like enzyme/uncharacterized membrane protein YdjX (TVP38/TMEM64 family)|nr:MAG: hypothetical protein CVV38_04090 [Candidatus Peregrinibacteria bacterium HGW-Peregrinibacteria-1]